MSGLYPHDTLQKDILGILLRIVPWEVTGIWNDSYHLAKRTSHIIANLCMMWLSPGADYPVYPGAMI